MAPTASVPDSTEASTASVNTAVRRRKLWGWGITFWLSIMMIISWADKGVIGLAAQPIMHDLGLTPGQFGLVSSSLFFLFCVTPIAVGLVANRISTRWVLAALVLCWSIAQVPVLIVAALPALVGSRVLLGAAEGPTTAIVVHHVYKWFPHRERALPAGIATGGAALGLAVAAPALTWVIEDFGWRAAFGVLTVVGVVWVVVWLVIGRDGPYTSYAASMSDSSASHGVDEQRKPDPVIPYRRILTTPTWLAATLGGHVAYWAISIWSAWLPSYLEEGLGYSSATAGSLMLAPSLVAFASMVGGGAVCRALLSRGVAARWACGGLEGAVVGIGGLALLGVVLLHPAGLMQILLLAVGFGLPFGALPLANMPVAEVSPVRQRAAVMSFSVIGMTVAGLFAPAVAGALIGTGADGYHHMMLLVGLVLLGGGAVAALAVAPHRDAQRLGLAEASPLDSPVRN